METIFLNELIKLIRQEAREEVRLQLLKLSKPDLEDSSENNNHFPIIESRIGWTKSKTLLEFLYNLLFSYGFITCNPEEFESHFFGSYLIRTKIFWKTTTVRLVLLFEFLYMKKIIPECNTPHILILEHIKFRNCESPTVANSLRTSLNNAHTDERMTKSKLIMEDIFNQLRKKIEEEENNQKANK